VRKREKGVRANNRYRSENLKHTEAGTLKPKADPDIIEDLKAAAWSACPPRRANAFGVANSPNAIRQ
jgi:hypothetical protein